MCRDSTNAVLRQMITLTFDERFSQRILVIKD